MTKEELREELLLYLEPMKATIMELKDSQSKIVVLLTEQGIQGNAIKRLEDDRVEIKSALEVAFDRIRNLEIETGKLLKDILKGIVIAVVGGLLLVGLRFMK